MADRSLPILPEAEERVLWGVHVSGQTRAPAHRPYWHENEARLPVGRAVLELVTHGTLTYREATVRWPVKSDQIVIFFYGDSTGYGHDQAGQHHRSRWCSVVGAGVTEHLRLLCGRHGSVFDAEPGSPLRLAFDAAMDLGRGETEGDPLDQSRAVHRLILALQEQVATRFEQHSTPAERAAQQLRDEPYRPLTIEQWAHEAGCTREHLSRLFTQLHGESASVYLTRMRTKRALDLLTTTNLPLREVARQAGFTSPAMLARRIRVATGEPPTALRTK